MGEVVTQADREASRIIPVEPAPVCLPPDDADIRMVLHAILPRCPFCGGTPTTFTRYFEHSGIYQSYVHCSWCMAQVFVNSRSRDEARNQAITAWSKRHHTTPDTQPSRLQGLG